MDRLETCIEILEQLVSFDTSSHRSNLPLISWIKAYLDRHGVETVLLNDPTGEKQNLIAVIGDRSLTGIVLSGHTDVVPADKDRWSSDPFRLRLEGDKAYGRGTTDMKGFLSVVLAAVPAMTSRGLKRPITLAFSYDEEVGCLGVPSLLDRLKPGQWIIVGEPTNLLPGIRHKGGRVQSMKIRGSPAHSGTPDLGVNAIASAIPVLQRLSELGADLAETGGGYPSNLVVTRISGGGPINLVPADCEVTWMLRAASKADTDQVDAELASLASEIDHDLKRRHKDAGAWLETSRDVPPFVRTAPDGVLDRLTQGRAPVCLTFGTEAGFYSEAGHDVIVCGPGDMAQGHTDDEFIEIKALADGCRFIEDVIGEACL